MNSTDGNQNTGTLSEQTRQEKLHQNADFEKILDDEAHKWLRLATAYLEACDKEWAPQNQLQNESDSLNQKDKCLKVDLRRIEGEIDVLVGAKLKIFNATCEKYKETRPAGNEAALDLIFREAMDGYEEGKSLKNERKIIRARIATIEEQKVVKETEIRAQKKKHDDVKTCYEAFEELRSRTETRSVEISNAQSTLLKGINEWKSGDEAALEEIPLVSSCESSGIPVNFFETLDRNDKRTSSDELEPSKKAKKPKYSDMSIVATDPSSSC